MSIKENSESSGSDIIPYNVGTEFAVFALDIPKELIVETGVSFIRITDKEGTFKIQANSFTPNEGMGTTPKEYINYYGNGVECAVGASKGYMSKVVKDGNTTLISYAFDGLHGSVGFGVIELWALPVNSDSEHLLDNEVIKAILNSVHAPN